MSHMFLRLCLRLLLGTIIAKSDANKLIEQRHGYLADINELEASLTTLLREQAIDTDDTALVSRKGVCVCVCMGRERDRDR